MDLNYLYHRQQVSLYMAENASCEDSRAAHRGLLAGYAARIEKAKHQRAQLELVSTRIGARSAIR